MLNEFLDAGYRVEHDWENLREDGEAWFGGSDTRLGSGDRTRGANI